MQNFKSLMVYSFLCVFCLLQMMASVWAQTLVKARLSSRDVAHVLERALKDTKIVLNNYGPLKAGSYHRKNQSYVVIGKGIGGSGRKQYIPLPEISKTVWRGRYSYLIHNVHSLKPRVRATTNGFVATIPFETKGAEMVGRCTAHKLSLKFWVRKKREVRPCKGLTGQKVMPDIHWGNPHIKIYFQPRLYGDSMTFYIRKVTVGGAIDTGKVCNWKYIGKRICDKVEGYTGEVKKQVGKLLMAQLSTPKIRHKIAKDILRRIDQKTGIFSLKVKQVSMNGGFIRVGLGL